MSNRRRQVARSPEDLAKKRDLILDAAMSLLADKGYPKTTMSEVATIVGIGRGTVYWHFASKDDLFFAALMREIDRIEAAIVPAQPTASTRDGFEQMLVGAFSLLDDAPNLLHVLLSLMAGAGEDLQVRLHDVFRKVYGRYNEVVEAMLEAGKRDGSVRPDLDSHITAAAIVALLDAMFLQIEFGLVPTDPERMTAAILALLESGYSTNRSV